MPQLFISEIVVSGNSAVLGVTMGADGWRRWSEGAIIAQKGKEPAVKLLEYPCGLWGRTVEGQDLCNACARGEGHTLDLLPDLGLSGQDRSIF